MPAEDDMLPQLVAWFEDSEQATQDARDKAERDRDFYDGKQLTQAEITAMEARKQPPLVINRIRRKIDYLQGLEKQSRQDPKAYPREPGDQGAADAATDALRYVVDCERFPQTASKCWENRLIDGACGVDVCVEEGGPTGYRILIKRIGWDRLFWDPHSREEDFSDAKYVGLVMWMDEDDVLLKWPDAAEAIETSYGAQTYSDTYDDRPKYAVWGDGKRKRVRVAQVYWQDAEGWQYAAFTKGGYLDDVQASPYVDEDDKPTCPLILGSAYVDRDNARYGVVRDMIDPQSEINKRRSKALHLLSVRQVIAEQGAVQDVDAARKELAKPDGYLEVAPQMRFDIQQTADLAAGQAQLLAEAKLELDGMGPNSSMQGKQGAEASGRAIALSQQGGLIEVGMLLDAHRDWKRRVYIAVWQRIRQFWTAETWVRVTDDEEAPRFVGLNVPMTLEKKLGEMDPAEAQQIVNQMGLQPGDPRLQQVVEVQNEAAKTTIDIVVDEAPDVVTLQQETFATLVEIAKGRPDVPFDMVIEAAPLHSNVKQKLLKRIRGEEGPNGGPPPEQPPPPELLIAQQKAQIDAQTRQQEAAARAAVEQEKLSAQMQIEQMRLEATRATEEARIAAEDRRKAAELEMQWQIATLNAGMKQAEHAAGQDMERERMAAEDRRAVAAKPAPAPEPAEEKPDLGAELGAVLRDMLSPIAARLEEVAAHATAPREIVRGPDGKAVGVKVGGMLRQISRGPDGKAMGLT